MPADEPSDGRRPSLDAIRVAAIGRDQYGFESPRTTTLPGAAAAVDGGRAVAIISKLTMAAVGGVLLWAEQASATLEAIIVVDDDDGGLVDRWLDGFASRPAVRTLDGRGPAEPAPEPPQRAPAIPSVFDKVDVEVVVEAGVVLVDPPSAVAKNGDQLDISLSEDLAPFTFHPKTVSGGGSFTIRNAAGEVLSTGTWVATKLNSFQSYGSTEVEPGVFLFGGTLHLHIALSTGEKAILRLRCTDFGNPPPGAVQGMALQVVGGNHFTGDWVFVGDDPVGSTQGATFFVEN